MEKEVQHLWAMRERCGELVRDLLDRGPDGLDEQRESDEDGHGVGGRIGKSEIEEEPRGLLDERKHQEEREDVDLWRVMLGVREGADLSDHEALDGVPKPPMADFVTNDGQ